MRMWWQGMVMVLGEAILRAVAGADGTAVETEDLAIGAGAARDEELLTRTTRSTGAPDWTGREGVAAGMEVVYFSLTITSSRRSSYLEATLECS